MDLALIRRVWLRAAGCCEYCRLPKDSSESNPFEIDHVISRKHQGPTVASNLALSCPRCNSFKGSDIAGRDPRTHKLTPLFNPRLHKWPRHFRWEGAYLVGRTAIGRTTIVVLRINDPVRLDLREMLIEEGLFPPA